MGVAKNMKHSSLFLFFRTKTLHQYMDINIKKIRKEKGLTMQSVADMSNLDPCRICMVEQRPQDRTIKMVEKVANALGYELTLKKKDED